MPSRLTSSSTTTGAGMRVWPSDTSIDADNTTGSDGRSETSIKAISTHQSHQADGDEFAILSGYYGSVVTWRKYVRNGHAHPSRNNPITGLQPRGDA
jgi:hypothetical protein